LEGELVFARLVLTCSDAVNDYLGKNCPYMAGAISFYTLFSIIPLLLAVVSALGFLLGDRTHEEQLDLAARISAVLPISSEFISEAVKSVVEAKKITGIASFFGMLWAATAVFGAIRKGVNAAWGIRKPRPFLKERLIDFALVLGAGVLLLAVLFMGPAVGLLLKPAVGVVREVTLALAPETDGLVVVPWTWVPQLLSPVLSFLTFLVLYRYLPNTEVRLGDVWPWALLASLAFYGTTQGFVWYVKSYSVYNLVYGSVGAVLALLTWVYLSANIVLLGALSTSRYARYVRSIEGAEPNLRTVWTGLSRVRLRVVESSGTG
jgi:membrane protein